MPSQWRVKINADRTKIRVIDPAGTVQTGILEVTIQPGLAGPVNAEVWVRIDAEVELTEYQRPPDQETTK